MKLIKVLLFAPALLLASCGNSNGGGFLLGGGGSGGNGYGGDGSGGTILGGGDGSTEIVSGGNGDTIGGGGTLGGGSVDPNTGFTIYSSFPSSALSTFISKYVGGVKYPIFNGANSYEYQEVNESSYNIYIFSVLCLFNSSSAVSQAVNSFRNSCTSLGYSISSNPYGEITMYGAVDSSGKLGIQFYGSSSTAPNGSIYNILSLTYRPYSGSSY